METNPPPATAAEKLLLCPFCGGEDVRCWGSDDPICKLCRVHCGCGIKTANHCTRKGAIETWNSRTPAADVCEVLGDIFTLAMAAQQPTRTSENRVRDCHVIAEKSTALLAKLRGDG